jgi:hypothetical protein
MGEYGLQVMMLADVSGDCGGGIPLELKSDSQDSSASVSSASLSAKFSDADSSGLRRHPNH